MITGPPEGTASKSRLQGYHAALAAAGVMPDPDLEVAADFLIEGGVSGANRLLALPEPPTAIFAFNDSLAVGALRAARARGLRLPEHLSVVGFDDTREASIVHPALTTVRQPLAELGRMAVTLLARLLDRQPFEPLHVELATKLVVRDSTAPPSARAPGASAKLVVGDSTAPPSARAPGASAKLVVGNSTAPPSA